MSVASIRIFAFELLRRHVLKRPEDRAFLGERLGLGGKRGIIVRFCLTGALTTAGGEPEVQEHRAVLRNNDVAGLHVAMDDALSMSFVERSGHLDTVAKRLLQRERTFLQALGERLAFEILHDEKIDAVFGSDIVEGANVGMIQARHRPRFLLEALPELLVLGKLSRQNFQRHGSV